MVNKFAKALFPTNVRLQGWHRSRRRNFSSTKPDVRMAETRDRSNFFDDSVRKRQKRRKKRERKKSSKMRGEKSDPLTKRLVVVKKKRKKREDRKL